MLKDLTTHMRPVINYRKGGGYVCSPRIYYYVKRRQLVIQWDLGFCPFFKHDMNVQIFLNLMI